LILLISAVVAAGGKLTRVSLTMVQWWQFFAGVVSTISVNLRTGVTTGVDDTSGKFAPGVNGVSGKLPPACQRRRVCTLSCQYLREFMKTIEIALELAGARGKTIHETHLK
jgi:hypothetical protein